MSWPLIQERTGENTTSSWTGVSWPLMQERTGENTSSSWTGVSWPLMLGRTGDNTSSSWTGVCWPLMLGRTGENTTSRCVCFQNLLKKGCYSVLISYSCQLLAQKVCLYNTVPGVPVYLKLPDSHSTVSLQMDSTMPRGKNL